MSKSEIITLYVKNSSYTYMKAHLLKLPTPSSITYAWNFGSLLGACLIIQLITGVLLSMHYSSSVTLAFFSVVHISLDVNEGWLIRLIHANGASFFFIMIYCHMARGLFFKSFLFVMTWEVGVLLLALFMGVAFLGYVLPWGQMSFWGATVITNMISAVPYLGPAIVEWVWGGFSVGEPTLMRFFSLHFLLPFLGLVLVIFHLILLHDSGSSNPLGLSLSSDKIEFHPLFTVKDLVGLCFLLWCFMGECLSLPFLFMDPENFSEANPLSTPPHIQPEWYFLFAYAILRSIPSKLGGVIALVLSISVFAFLPLSTKTWKNFKSSLHKAVSCSLFGVFITLSWVGAFPVEEPYLIVGQVSTVMYFLCFFLMCLL
nr:cytochrome b [Austromenopon atrofulvum]